MYLPQERINEIARRRVIRVGFTAKPGATGALEGSAAFASLTHPVTRERIADARFRVVSHDRLAFLDGPLAAVEPVHFHDVGTAVTLEERLQSILETRAQQAQVGVRELQRLGVEARVNNANIVAVGEVATGGKSFTLWADGRRARIVEVRTGGTTQAFGGPTAMLELTSFPSPVDLELELSVRLSQLQAAPVAPAPGPEHRHLVVATPSPGMTLHALLARFGAGVRASALEIEEDLSDGAEAFRLTAVLQQGSMFHITIRRGSDPSRPAFAEVVDLARVDSTLALASTVLGRPLPVTPAAGAAEKPEASAMLPEPGEVWIMMVLVERDENDEIRYVLADFDGRPYGAQRVLKRADFLAVFQEQRGSYRLRVRIKERRGTDVVYRQLDGGGHETTTERSVSSATFMSTFFPEAMAY